MINALLIPVDGAPSKVSIDGELDSLQAAVGGWIEGVSVVAADCEVTMYVNEDGIATGLPMNLVATALARQFIMPGDYIKGPAIIVAIDRHGDTAACPDAVFEALGLGGDVDGDQPKAGR